MTRTIFVNPAMRRPSKKKAAPKKSQVLARRPSAPAPRRRTANAAITPFVAASNPVVVRRTKRRRAANPLAKISVKSTVKNLLASGGGAALAVGADVLAFQKIQHTYGRNGARMASAVAAAAFLPGSMGAATAGALMTPVMQEVAAYFLGGAPAAAVSVGEAAVTTEADLDLLSQDLGAMLDPEDLKAW